MGILRRLREWREDADGTLKGPAFETDELSLGNDGPATSFNDIGGGGAFTSGDFIGYQYLLNPTTSGATISSTTFTAYEDIVGGGFSVGKLPTDITAYGKIAARAESPGDGETLEITARVRPIDDTSTTTDISEVAVTFDGGFETKVSEWSEITSLSAGQFVGTDFVARVSDGSADVSSALEPSFVIGYQVD